MNTTPFAAAAALVLAAGLGFSLLAQAEEPAVLSDDLVAALYAEGEEIFPVACAACHGEDGGGLIGPALRVNTSSARGLVRTMVNGINAMPPVAADFSHREIAALATYIRNSWGNEYGPVTEEEVAEFLTPIVF